MELSKAATNMHILCLDNDREWLNILSRELKAVGIRDVQTATDPKKALGLMLHTEVNLVVTHHDLKFVKFLRQNKASPSQEVPVIMITSRVSPEDIFAIRDAGVNEIAVKPCSISQLAQRIEAVATNPRRFVWSENFTGPNRRRKDSPFGGPERREVDD